MHRFAAYLTVLALLPVIACDPGGQRSAAAAAVPGGVVPIADAPSETIPTVARRVSSKADPLASPSPDGRFLSLTDWTTGDVAVLDLETGDTRHVTNNPAPYVPGYANFTLVSPDGSEIAYAWWDVERDIAELWVVGWDGGEPRLLRSDSIILPYAWSKDGRYILAGRTAGAADAIELVRVATADGALTVLAALGSFYPLHAEFSPDGRFIAYDGPGETYADQRDVYLLEIDGRRSTRVIDDASHDYLLGWAPDGEHILYSSDRTGTPGVWLLRVRDGRPAGAPALVLPDAWSVLPFAFLDDGRYYYGEKTGGRDIYVATLADDYGSVVVPPDLATPRRLGGSSNPAWSPDGRHLAYISTSVPIQSFSSYLVIRSMETGERRQLQLEAGLRPMMVGRWTPDGRSLVVVAGDDSGPTGIYKVDVRTGQNEALVSERLGYTGVGAELGPNGRVLYYRMEVEGAPVVFRKDLDSGDVEEVHQASASQIRYMALSPNGSSLALTLVEQDGQARLAVIPARGGEPRDLTPPLPAIGSIAWTPDGTSILYSTYVGDPAERRWGVWRVALAGGEPQPIGLEMDGEILRLRLHPDGRRLAFVGGLIAFELWVMEDFLPDDS